MEETSAPSDRRSQPRYAVDEAATVHFIAVRAQLSGRILDLSMSGCRIRTSEQFPVGIYRRVETEFKLDGLPFRLGGVVQSVHDKFTVGIRFLDLSPRKRDQLASLIGEIEACRSTGARTLRATNPARPESPQGVWRYRSPGPIYRARFRARSRCSSRYSSLFDCPS